MEKKKIIVVEDNILISIDIRTRLIQMDYDVVCVVNSGEDAVSKSLELKPDVIIMDIKLSGSMDGIEAARKIHEVFGIPVIFVSAYADEETIERANLVNPVCYIVKPFENVQLYTAIESALSDIKKKNPE